MIKTKIIKKPKQGTTVVRTGGGFGGSSSGHAQSAEYAAEAGHAKEADHAAIADGLSDDSTLHDEFLSKKKDDSTPHKLGAGSLEVSESTKTRTLEVEESATAGSLQVQQNATVGTLRSKGDAAVEGSIIAEGATRSKEFAPDQVGGFGWLIDLLGNGTLESLTLRSFLEVPELRFNRVTVQVGNLWIASAAGIVESYTRSGSTPQYCVGRVNLKLEEGELGSFVEGDICMGIWHDTEGNATTNASKDNESLGEFRFAGFKTCFFEVTDVSSDTKSFLMKTRNGYTFEPVPGMHIVGYGNKATNPDGSYKYPERQRSAYISRNYFRFLKDVRDWRFTADTLAMQFGDLTNLSVFGIEMEGYSGYMHNVYFDGVIRQLQDPEFLASLKGDTGDPGATGAVGPRGPEGASFGFNLILDSRQKPTSWTVNNGSGGVSVSDDPDEADTKLFTTTPAGTAEQSAYGYIYSGSYAGGLVNAIRKGGKYTLSFDYKSSSPLEVRVYFDLCSSSYTSHVGFMSQRFEATSEWQRGYVTFDVDELPANGLDYTTITIYTGASPDSARHAYFRKFCLAEGTMQEWMYAQEETKGNPGIQGATVRLCGPFNEDTYYYNGKDEEKGTGMYWLDVVWTENASFQRTYWRCIKSGTSQLSGGKPSAAHWEEMSYISALFAEIIVANQGNIKMLSSGEIVFYDQNNSIIGRIGAPLNGLTGFESWKNGIIQWFGGTSVNDATYTLSKSGVVRFGTQSGERVMIDPTRREITIYDSQNRNVVLIDGKTHDLDAAYGVSHTQFAGEMWTDTPELFGTSNNGTLDRDVVMAKGVAIGAEGATLRGGLFVDSALTELAYNIQSSTGTGTQINARRYTTVSFSLEVRDSDTGKLTEKVSSPVLASATFDPPSVDTGTTGSGRLQQAYPPGAITQQRGWIRTLPEGTYDIVLNVSITVTTSGSGVLSQFVSGQLKLRNFNMRLKMGSSPKCFLGANGVLVANSTQDYLKAGTVDGKWTVEAVSDGIGLRLTDGNIYCNQGGIWRQLNLAPLFVTAAEAATLEALEPMQGLALPLPAHEDEPEDDSDPSDDPDITDNSDISD